MSDWTTLLSLLVALIAVIGAVAPIIKQALTPSKAVFVFDEPSIEPGVVLIRARNEGGAPALIDAATITVPQRSAGQPYIYVMEAEQKTDIAPGESRLLRFKFDHKQYDPPAVGGEDSPCEIEVYDSHRRLSCDEVRYLGTTLPPADRKGGLPEEGPLPLATPAPWERY